MLDEFIGEKIVVDLRSPYVCLGYHNQPEVTAAKLSDGWLRTGDIFHRDADGFYFFRSRVDVG